MLLMLKPAHPSQPEQRANAREQDTAQNLLRRIPSTELLGQQRVVEIAHQGQIYQLRLTAAGKLILTK